MKQDLKHGAKKGMMAWKSRSFPRSWTAAALLGGAWLFAAGGCVRDAHSGSVPSPSRSPPSSTTAASGESTVGGAAVAARVSSIKDGGAPEQAGDQLLTMDVDAIRTAMRKARGRALIVHLWATWCGPCLDELPTINKLASVARARGVRVLSLSLDTDYRGIARIASILRARAPNLTAAVAYFDNADQFMSLFSRSWEGTIPALFAFDATGKLKTSLIGEVDSATLNGLLAKLAPVGSPPP